MNKLNNIYKNRKPFIIGMLHCAPLLGYNNFPGEKRVKDKFQKDLLALIDGGIDAIMIENNYDIPHYECAKRSTVPILTKLCLKARQITKKPLGLSVLWNDYETAISVAKIANFNFVRIPVFIDKVKTHYGTFEAKADECLAFRKKIKADDILIFADIQVKHAQHLIKQTLNKSIQKAIKKGADGIIITGKWTGDPPSESDVTEAKSASKNTPVILGSGITPGNILRYNADAAIIGTYFKGQLSQNKKNFHNVFTWETTIQKRRVRRLMNYVKNQTQKNKY